MKYLKNPTEKIIVNSRAYGRHERAPRGSRSIALLNPAMEAHGRRLRESTIPAGLILRALQPFRQNFTGGLLWQKLVKHFAAQAKRGIPYSVQGIADWDLNTQYPTSRLMVPDASSFFHPDSDSLEVTLKYYLSDRLLKRKKDFTAFRITMIFFFPDFEHNEISVLPIVLPDKLLTDSTPAAFLAKVPPRGRSYLICFKAEACVNGVLSGNSPNVDKAMCLLASGKLL